MHYFMHCCKQAKTKQNINKNTFFSFFFFHFSLYFSPKPKKEKGKNNSFFENPFSKKTFLLVFKKLFFPGLFFLFWFWREKERRMEKKKICWNKQKQRNKKEYFTFFSLDFSPKRKRKNNSCFETLFKKDIFICFFNFIFFLDGFFLFGFGEKKREEWKKRKKEKKR